MTDTASTSAAEKAAAPAPTPETDALRAQTLAACRGAAPDAMLDDLWRVVLEYLIPIQMWSIECRDWPNFTQLAPHKIKVVQPSPGIEDCSTRYAYASHCLQSGEAVRISFAPTTEFTWPFGFGAPKKYIPAGGRATPWFTDFYLGLVAKDVKEATRMSCKEKILPVGAERWAGACTSSHPCDVRPAKFESIAIKAVGDSIWINQQGMLSMTHDTDGDTIGSDDDDDPPRGETRRAIRPAELKYVEFRHLGGYIEAKLFAIVDETNWYSSRTTSGYIYECKLNTAQKTVRPYISTYAGTNGGLCGWEFTIATILP